jgi:hypothetical protein
MIRKYEPPIGVEGGFCDDLFILFDKENEKCFNFELAGSEKLRDRTALILQINAKENARLIGGRCKVFGPGEKNTAWIDSESMQVMRIQRSPVKVGFWNGPFSGANGIYFIHPLVDYAKTAIKDSFYWLPAVKRVEFIQAKGPHSYLYVLDYSNYHMFQVSTKLAPINAGQAK